MKLHKQHHISFNHITNSYSQATHERPSPEDWYNSLLKQEKKKVLRTGVQNNTEYFNDGNHLE